MITKRPGPTITMFYVSPKSYAVLCNQARSYGFITAPERQRGLHRYVEWLSAQEFIDTRPNNVKADDQFLMEQSKMPQWSDNEQRQHISLSIPHTTRNRILHICKQFMITNYMRADSFELPTSQISAWLEAIGLGWLTPNGPPLHPPTHARMKPK